MSQQHILIVLESGAFQGANITTDTGSPMPLDLAAPTALLPDINAAALQTLDSLEVAHAEALAAKDAELAATATALQQLEAFRDGMVQRVTEVLQSGDPEQFAALAVDFLTPEQEKIRAEKLALLAELKAELGIE